MYYISAFQIYIHLRAQAPVHEAPFLERHPPLARFARSIGVQFLNEPRSEFPGGLAPNIGEGSLYRMKLMKHPPIFLETHLHLRDSRVVHSVH